MRKIIVLLLALYVILACGFTLTDFDNDERDSSVGFIILPHSQSGYLTRMTANNASILGASNPDFPVYINDEQLSTTANGFFAVYVALELGRNVFEFRNGEATTELIITRIAPPVPTPARRVNFSRPVYGRTISGNVARFYDGDDNRRPGTPLARGTTFRIIAEQGDTYILHDGSYVYSSRVERITADDAYSTDAIQLYSVKTSGKSATVTVYPIDSEPEHHEYVFNAPITGHSVIGRGEDGEQLFEFHHPPTRLRDAWVLVDAGHGGNDPGALGPPGRYGAMEKCFNSIVAMRTVEILRTNGVNTVFSRDKDETFPILERMEQFEETPFDFIVSVHANSTSISRDFRTVTGAQMYFTLDQSEQAANDVIAHIAANTAQSFTPAIRRNFAMARHTVAPSMLFEKGFICNPADYEKLLDENYLALIATSLAEGIIAYLIDNGAERFEPKLPVIPKILLETSDEPQISVHPPPREALGAERIFSIIIGVVTVVAMIGLSLCILKDVNKITKTKEENEHEKN
jgi:N-acetylmuramoyl-L-alanine amidase